MEGNKELILVEIVFSLVTAWIFSRSLLTSAILAYYYGLPGAIAYTAYYFSYITGRYFIVYLRKNFRLILWWSFLKKNMILQVNFLNLLLSTH